MSGWSSRPEVIAAAGLALLLAACLQAPPASGDGPVAVCGTTRVLADEFDAESAEWGRYGESVLEDGKVLLYAAPETGAGMFSTWEYQLAGSELTMQLRRADVGDGRLTMLLVNREDDAVGLELSGSTLALFQAVGETYTTPHSLPYTEDIVWWRLREADGQLFWSTSTDGSMWVDQGSLALELAGPVSVLIELEAASQQAVIEIEAIVPSADEDLCPAASLTDEFDAEHRSWHPSGELAGCTVSGDQGTLRIGHDGVDRCGLESAEHFDLTASSFAVELVEAGDCDLSAWLTVLLPDLYPEIGCVAVDGSPQLVVQVTGDGEAPGQLATTPFDPSLHRFWRIRHDADARRLLFETGDTEGKWSQHATTPIDDQEVRGAGVSLQAGDDTPDGVSDPVVFDRFNLVP